MSANPPRWEAERRRLEAAIGESEKARHRLEGELAEARRELAEARGEARRALEAAMVAEAHGSRMAMLYVAVHRLRASQGREEVLEAIGEIVCNLIGSEEYAVYEVEPAVESLQLVASRGVEAPSYDGVPIGFGAIGRSVLRGETFIAGSSDTGFTLPGESSLLACVPLKIDNLSVGAVGLFGLLGHKRGFERVDLELFDVLASHGGLALYLSRRLGGGPLAQGSRRRDASTMPPGYSE